jgi:hypothetical protein
MLKGTRSKRKNQKRQTRRLRSGGQKQRGGNPDENLERKQFKYWIDILFFGARNTTFGIPDQYRMKIMNGMAHFALEQLTSDDPEDEEIIYEAFEKWAGEPYKSVNNDSDDDEENNQNGG